MTKLPLKIRKDRTRDAAEIDALLHTDSSPERRIGFADLKICGKALSDLLILGKVHRYYMRL